MFKENDKVEFIKDYSGIKAGQIGEVIEVNAYGYNFAEGKEIIQLTVEFENNVIVYVSPDMVRIK
jgi:hypothetical protein